MAALLFLFYSALATPVANAQSSADAAAIAKAFKDGASMGYSLNAAGQDRATLMNSATTQAGSLYPGTASGLPGGVGTIFAGGRGDMATAGNTRAASCAGFTPHVGTATAPLTAAQQAENAECGAINLVTSTYTLPAYSTTKNDPALTASRAVAKDPAGFVASQGILTGGATGTTCTPTTRTVPATFSKEICDTDIGASLADSFCSISYSPTDSAGHTSKSDGCATLAARPDCGMIDGVCNNSGTMAVGSVTIYLDNGSQPVEDWKDEIMGKFLPPSAVASGVTCWQSTIHYQCIQPATSSTTDCDGLQARGCTYVSSSCTSYYPTTPPVCEREEDVYSCPTGDSKTIAVSDCTTRVGCTTNPDGSQNCIDSSYKPDADFGAAMTAMELGREAGTYTDGARVLTGVSMSCESKRYGFATRCCEVSGGAMANSSFMTATMMQNAMTVSGDVLNYAWHAASAVNYDALFQNNAPDWLKDGVGAWSASGEEVVSQLGEKVLVDATGAAVAESATSAVANVSFGTSISAAGVTLAYNTSTAGVAGAMQTFMMDQVGGPLSPDTMAWLGMAKPIPITKDVFGINGLNLSFDPVSFGITMAFMAYSALTSCGESEMRLGMARGSDLCAYVGETCSSGFLGFFKSCQKNYCCYNSKLAMLVNEQALSQIGRTLWAGDCGGFTPTEMSNLDWSKIDLSAFTNDILSQVTYPDTAAIASRAPAVVSKVRGYYGP